MSFTWLASATALPLAAPLEESTPDGEGSGAAAGREGAPVDFDAVYTGHFDFVWRSLLRLGLDHGSVDDAAHDVFLVVYRHLARFDGRNLKGWLFAITQRVAWHYRRAYARRRADPIDEDACGDADTCPEVSRERREAHDLVQVLLSRLSEERRTVFVLFELEQLGMPEIAAMLRIPLNTAYSRLRLARRDFSRNLHRLELERRRVVP